MNATISRHNAGGVLAAVALVASTAGRAAADVEVASAAVDLYARMTARDLAGALRYIPAADSPQKSTFRGSKFETMRCCPAAGYRHDPPRNRDN